MSENEIPKSMAEFVQKYGSAKRAIANYLAGGRRSECEEEERAFENVMMQLSPEGARMVYVIMAALR